MVGDNEHVAWTKNHCSTLCPYNSRIRLWSMWQLHTAGVMRSIQSDFMHAKICPNPQILPKTQNALSQHKNSYRRERLTLWGTHVVGCPWIAWSPSRGSHCYIENETDVSVSKRVHNHSRLRCHWGQTPATHYSWHTSTIVPLCCNLRRTNQDNEIWMVSERKLALALAHTSLCLLSPVFWRHPHEHRHISDNV